jgi:hypothetical protein
MWVRIGKAELWQCVALSLNIDPDKVHGWIKRYGDFVSEESDEFNTRLRIAVAQDDATLQCLAIVMDSPTRATVGLRQFAAWWVRQIGWPAPPELLAMAEEQKTPMPASPAASHDAAATAATSKHSANVGGDNAFTAMPGLRWDEIIITFAEPEAVRVKARDKTETFTYDAMGFKHRKSREAKPNRCWSLFRGLAMVSTSDKTWSEACPTSNLKRGMARLRDQLQLFFRIHADPIVFKKDGYQPAFILTIEEHVIRKVREQYPSRASEDEGEEVGEDWQGEMEEVPGTRSR